MQLIARVYMTEAKIKKKKKKKDWKFKQVLAPTSYQQEF